MNTAFARRQMVRQQVRTCEVDDERVLATLSDLERDAFVPQKFAHLAYADVEIPLPHNQRMLMPSIEGRLLQTLAVAPGDRVLEIGTGSGYMTACLARLGTTVVSLEVFPDLSEDAARALDAAGVENVELEVADAMQELPDGTFDAIAITGSMPNLDDRFVSRLAPGGKLFAFVGSAPIMQARLLRKDASGAVASDLAVFEALVQPLIGAARRTAFEF